MNEPTQEQYARFGMHVAALLGSNSEWKGADTLQAIAEAGTSLLPIPFNTDSPMIHAFWGKVADQLGIENDAPEAWKADLWEIAEDVRNHEGDYVGSVEGLIEEVIRLRSLITDGGPVYEEVRFALASDSMSARDGSLSEIADKLGIPIPEVTPR